MIVYQVPDLMSDNEESRQIRLTYPLELVLIRKNFLTQKPENSTNETWKIKVSGIGDLKVTLWPKIQPYLRREAIVNGQQIEWSKNELPAEDELGKFIMFYDQTNRRSYKLDLLTEDDLDRWSDERKISLFICHYSTAIANKSIWLQLEKKLIKPAAKDKAGAAAESALDEMVRVLKEAHRWHYEANYITWRMWADFILKQPGHQWESLTQSPPPHHMLHLFTAARTNPDNLVSELRQNLSIGKSINSSFEDDIGQIATEFKQLKVKFDGLVHGMTAFEARLDAIQFKCKTTGDNLSLFEVAVPPEDNEFSTQMFNKMSNQEDVDHE